MKLYTQIIEQIVERQKALDAQCHKMAFEVRHRIWHLAPELCVRVQPEALPQDDLSYYVWHSRPGRTVDRDVLSEWSVSRVVGQIWSPAVQARPREALRRVRIMQALSNWIQARIDGLDAQAVELKRQQAAWNDKLEAEQALAALAERPT